jgi:hypothetical protein
MNDKQVNNAKNNKTKDINKLNNNKNKNNFKNKNNNNYNQKLNNNDNSKNNNNFKKKKNNNHKKKNQSNSNFNNNNKTIDKPIINKNADSIIKKEIDIELNNNELMTDKHEDYNIEKNIEPIIDTNEKSIIKNNSEVKVNKKEKTKSNNKSNLLLNLSRILIGLSIIIIIVAIILIKNADSKEEIKYNKNESFIEDKVVKGIMFKNIECIYDGKDSTVSYTMINKTTDKIYLNNYDIIIKDKNGNRLIKIAVHISDAINPLESLNRVDRVVGIDLTDAYEMELIINTEAK